MRLILASASPRRAALLRSAGFDFEVRPAEVDETPYPDEAPDAYALRVARAKVERIGRTRSRCWILAADTVVVGLGRILGKPRDREDAAAMLMALSGRAHEVHTAVVVRGNRRERSHVDTTRVYFAPLTDDEIVWYLGTGEPRGKAGAYAIQGQAARFIDRIEGSWSNVVGLPIATVHRLLKEVGEAV